MEERLERVEKEIEEEVQEELREAEELEELLETQEYDLYRAKKRMEQLLPVVILLLTAVLYLEFFVSLTPAQHEQVVMLEKAILAYFVIEILIDFLIIEGHRDFLEEKWLDILLVIPFFTLFREVGRVLSALKAVKPAKGLKTLKLPKAFKVSKLLKGRRLARDGRGLRGAGHIVKKGKELVEEAFEERVP